MDVEYYKKVAYGALQLKPQEFYDLTMSELFDLMEGYNRHYERERRDQEDLVYLLMIAPRMKKIPTADKLFNRKKEKQAPKKLTEKDKKKTLEDLDALFSDERGEKANE